MAQTRTSKTQKPASRRVAEPAKTDDPEARNIHVKFLVNRAENNMLQHMAKSEGLRISDLVRQMIRKTYQAAMKGDLLDPHADPRNTAPAR
jgi:hypothetical protein